MICELTYSLTHSLALPQVTGKQQYLAKHLRADQLLLGELEFEWIRQFYVQGARHHALHKWWHAPIQVLLLSGGSGSGRKQ